MLHTYTCIGQYAHTHSVLQTHSHCLTRIHTYIHEQAHKHTLTLPHTQRHTYTHTLHLTHIHTQSHTHRGQHTPCFTHTHTLRLFHTYTHTYMDWHTGTHIHSHCLTHIHTHKCRHTHEHMHTINMHCHTPATHPQGFTLTAARTPGRPVRPGCFPPYIPPPSLPHLGLGSQAEDWETPWLSHVNARKGKHQRGRCWNKKGERALRMALGKLERDRCVLRAGGPGWTQSRKKRKCYDNFFQSWHLRRAGFWSRGWAFWGQSLLGNLKTSLRALGSSQARQWCRRCVLRSSARPLVRGFMDFCLHSGFKPTWVNLRLADETLDETVRQKPHGGG